MRATIAINADEDYSFAGQTLLRSIASNLDPSSYGIFDVVIIGYGDWSDRSIGEFRRLSREYGFALQFYSVGARYQDLPVVGPYRHAVYNRLSLSDACQDAKRVICLDADMIALANLGALFELDLRGQILGAVQDPCVGGSELTPFAEINGKRYFNSGLLVIDMDEWRRLEVAEECLHLLRQPSSSPYPDQDMLNVAIGDRWLDLDARWNVFHFDELISQDMLHLFCRELLVERAEWLQREAYLLHYAGPLKPWRDNYPSGVNLRRFQLNT